MKSITRITTIIILAFALSASGCSSRTPVTVSSDTAATTSIATETKEPTVTAAIITADPVVAQLPTETTAVRTAPEQTATASETTAATSVTATSAPKETAAPTSAATTKATSAATVKPTTGVGTLERAAKFLAIRADLTGCRGTHGHLERDVNHRADKAHKILLMAQRPVNTGR